ncbi:MAG: hypothetical protein KDB40_10955 [Acidimicrobiales bacterium]|nr:hypothetical protein [Acidimicrobiales bacterium]MCB9393798.1 hypothetical protein [Acidimicrobiaceae bacterium]
MSELAAARQLHAEMKGYINALPDAPAASGDLSVKEKFEEVDRIVNAVREITARQVIILDLIISHLEASR